MQYLMNYSKNLPLLVTTVTLDFSEDILASSGRLTAPRVLDIGDCNEWIWVSVSEPPW